MDVIYLWNISKWARWQPIALICLTALLPDKNLNPNFTKLIIAAPELLSTCQIVKSLLMSAGQTS